MIQQSVNMLGMRAKDKITGLEGVVTSVCFDLYGCVSANIVPKVVDNKPAEGSGWFDIKRLEVSGERVMNVPPFASMQMGEEGGPAAEKPGPR